MTAKDLKNALLQEAVQGKLVPQKTCEGNARDLLEEIRKARGESAREFCKAKLGSERKRTDNAPMEITEDEIPFDIPESWCWCRLGDVIEIARGGSPRPIQEYLTTSEDSYNWIKIGDTDKDGKYINSTKERIKKEGLHKTRLVHKGDFLLTNSMSFGRPYILNIDGCIHDGWLVFSNYQLAFDKDFLYYVLSSSFAYEQFCGVVSGAVVKNLNTDKVSTSIFPLPPLAEQKRIVAAIEKFMPLIEEYGKKETVLNELNAQIGTLTKKAILQEAVQGKLVPQILAEGNAKDLLEQIKAQKAALIKEGKIKKEKPLPEITEDEIPFDIPENWCWCRLGEVVDTNIGLTYSPTDIVTDGGTSVLRSNNIQNGKIVYDDLVHVSKKVPEKCLSRKGDLLICARNGSKALVGKSALIEQDGMAFGAFMALVRSPINSYILYFINSPVYRSKLEGVNTTTINQITQDNLRETLFPLPPLSEQKRIVAAIEQLLPLCEKLGK